MNDEFIIFFDGVCNLCNGFVDFLVGHDDRKGGPSFKIASLQGQTAAQKLPVQMRDQLNSIVLLAGGQTYTKSAAVWRIFARLPWPWRAFFVVQLIPPSVADWLYDLVAKHRYNFFGKKESCRLPTPAEKEYFLE